MVLQQEKRKLDHDKQRTLIICPKALLDQWFDEINNKAPNQFKVSIYHHSGRQSSYPPERLQEFDVIITTYGITQSDYAKGGKDKEQSGLFKLPHKFFHRIVLDEAQSIKNGSTSKSKACTALGKCVSVRWCLTGTPIENKLTDIFALSRFLQIENCETLNKFKQSLNLINDGGNKEYIGNDTKMAITAFLGLHMLRRLKDEVVKDLPSKTEEIVALEFDIAERDIYDSYLNDAKLQFNRYLQDQSTPQNYLHCLVKLLRLRQITGHPFLVFKQEKDNDLEVIGNNHESDLMETINQKIIDKINNMNTNLFASECCICYDLYNDGIMLHECGHFICRQHLADLNRCPDCQNEFDPDKIISFDTIIKYELVTNHKHKKLIFETDIKNDLLPNDEIIFQKMHSSMSQSNINKNIKIIWRKVQKATGKYRSQQEIQNEQLENINNEQRKENEKKEKKRKQLQKIQNGFDWKMYEIDEIFETMFDEDDKNGYNDNDKYPNKEFGYEFIPSSKTKALIQKVRWIRENKPKDKIIIFSQFTGMLYIIQRVLRKYKIHHYVYDGSKSRYGRQQIIESFKNDVNDNRIPILLMSLKCGAFGLNLTMANHVIFVDLVQNL